MLCLLYPVEYTLNSNSMTASVKFAFSCISLDYKPQSTDLHVIACIYTFLYIPWIVGASVSGTWSTSMLIFQVVVEFCAVNLEQFLSLEVCNILMTRFHADGSSLRCQIR